MNSLLSCWKYSNLMAMAVGPWALPTANHALDIQQLDPSQGHNMATYVSKIVLYISEALKVYSGLHKPELLTSLGRVKVTFKTVWCWTWRKLAMSGNALWEALASCQGLSAGAQ